MIERGTSPEAAAQALIHQPAVQHEIHRQHGSFHLDGAQPAFPESSGVVQGFLDLPGGAVAIHQGPHFRGGADLSQKEGHLGVAARIDRHQHLQHPGAIQRGTRAVVELGLSEGRGRRHGPVSSQELRTVAGMRNSGRAGREKCGVARGMPAPEAAGQKGIRWRVPLRLNVQLLELAIRAEHPGGEVSGAQTPASGRMIGQTQAAHFHWIEAVVGQRGNENSQFLADRMAVVFVHRVPMAVPGAIRVFFPDGRRGGGPNRPGFFIPQIDRFPLGIGHRIVAPRGEAIGLAVASPRESQTAFGDQCSEARSRDDIRPGGRGDAAGLQINGVLAAVRREATQAVEVGQVEKRQRTRRLLHVNAYREHDRRHGELGSGRQLLLKRSAASIQHGARSRQDQVAIPLRQREPVPQENAARPFLSGLQGMGLDQTLQLLPQRPVVTGLFQVRDHQIGLKSAGAPVGVRQQQFANQRQVALLANQGRHDRQVARNAMRPQILLSKLVAVQPVLGRTQARIGIQQVAAEFLKAVRGGRANAEIAEFQLRARPGHFEGAGNRFGAGVLVH